MTNLKVTINDTTIDAADFQQKTVLVKGKERRKINFDFKVRSEESHDITSLLYKNDFIVKIPEKQLEFPATIYNYSTSITDLAVEGAIADFKLELIEKV